MATDDSKSLAQAVAREVGFQLRQILRDELRIFLEGWLHDGKPHKKEESTSPIKASPEDDRGQRMWFPSAAVTNPSPTSTPHEIDTPFSHVDTGTTGRVWLPSQLCSSSSTPRGLQAGDATPERTLPVVSQSAVSNSGLDSGRLELSGSVDITEWARRHPRGFIISEELRKVGLPSQSPKAFSKIPSTGKCCSSRRSRVQEADIEPSRTWSEPAERFHTGSDSPLTVSSNKCRTPANFYQNPRLNSAHRWAKDAVEHQLFDEAILVFVFLNAAMIGGHLEYKMAHLLEEIPIYFKVAEWAFAVTFACEIILRIFVVGPGFFYLADWRWNVFDATVVTVQVVELVATEMLNTSETRNLLFVRCLRIMRIFRIIRIYRILHLVRELRVVVGSVAGALRPFFWTIGLFGLMIYVFAVAFLQIVVDAWQTRPNAMNEIPGLSTYWGSLRFCTFSLFQSLLGGVDWENVVNPLMELASPWVAPLFMFYISFATFVMMNLVTGIFFDLTFNKIRETQDREVIHQVKELFLESDKNNSGHITYEEFEHQLESPLMRDCFKVIDLDLSEAKGLFGLLDRSGSGSISLHEFVTGCLRLRGPARSIDLAILMLDRRQMALWWETNIAALKAQMTEISRRISHHNDADVSTT